MGKQQDIGLLTDIIKRVIHDVHQPESYLFLGKAYDTALDGALPQPSDPKYMYMENWCVYDREGFSIYDFIASCTRPYPHEESVTTLRLKNKGEIYQRVLLVPLERLTMPLLVFADNDTFIEPFMSRFTRIEKQINENLKVPEFISPDKMLSRYPINTPYLCPSLLKLGNYNKLSPSEKNMDELISRLSDGKVYPEVLSELQPPIKSFDENVELAALSLLRQRLY